MSTQAVEKAQSNAVAERPTTVKGWMESPEFKAQLAKVLPKHLTPERQLRVGLTALMKVPKIAECTIPSVMKAMLDCSSLGLEPDGRYAHLIPYGTTCTLIIDYKGLVALAMRSGQVANIHADMVCENDVFEYDRGELKTHKIDFRKPRGNAYAYYSLVKMKDGTETCQVMSLEEVEAVRKRSKSGSSGPWVTDFPEMAKKTVFKRHSKWLPLSSEFRDAIAKDDEIEREAVVTSVETKAPVFLGAIKEQAAPVVEDAEIVLKEHQQALKEFVESNGFTWDDFAKNVAPKFCKDATSWATVPDSIAKLLVKSQDSLKKALGGEA